MREISAQQVTAKVAELFEQANFTLGEDVLTAMQEALNTEESPIGQTVLEALLDNAAIARSENLPLCQDCGTAVVFLEIGQDVHVSGGDLYTAVNDGVRLAYDTAYLRKSIVTQPYSARTNTKDNTPAVIHADIVPGEYIKITVMPKGGGAENMSRLGMLSPGDGRQGIVDFIVSAVEQAGGKPCPPLVVGVGIGGTSDKVMLLAKKALLRPITESSPDVETAELEQELLKRINQLGVGPLGLGGRITALAVHVEVFPAHIASMPVAVNLQCHSSRHEEAVI